ncbi:ectonucleoside triphosphate diphosphohydrolase 5/6 [Nematocida sp. AWRm77]|nr:ectonucleoside triphosphate diphosphohydrolase 5/6 [Nematocida sp. AWRm77]
MRGRAVGMLGALAVPWLQGLQKEEGASLLQSIKETVGLVSGEIKRLHALEKSLESLSEKVKGVESAAQHAQEDQFVAVFDGGSTGTRLNIYKFDSKGLILKEHMLRSTHPGIHQAKDPEKILAELLEKGKVFLKQHRGSTEYNFPVVFNATAGMRLLDVGKRNALLKQIKSTLETQLKKKDIEVRVIDGKEEGFYAWSALVFVTKMKEKIGIIDLGGGSAQISFEIDKDHQASEDGVVHGKTKNVLSRSFLGMGLVAGVEEARKADTKKVCAWNSTEFDIAECKRHIKATVGRMIQERTGGKEVAPGISQVSTIFVSSFISEILQMIKTPQEIKFQDMKELVDSVCKTPATSMFSGSLSLASAELAPNPEILDKKDQSSTCISVIYAIMFMESLGVGLFTPIKDAGLIPVDISWSLGRALSLIE